MSRVNVPFKSGYPYLKVLLKLRIDQYTQNVRKVITIPTKTNSANEAGNSPQKTSGIAKIEVGI
jgi:hypothetical protein